MIKRIKIQEKRAMTREEFITLSKDHILYLDGATGSNAFWQLPGAVDP